jgi:hypothetical protein
LLSNSRQKEGEETEEKQLENKKTFYIVHLFEAEKE